MLPNTDPNTGLSSWLNNLSSSEFLPTNIQTVNLLNTAAGNPLFVPILGQSNGEFLSYIYDPYQPGSTVNEDSGAIVLERSLTNLSSSNIITSTTRETNFGIGGSIANGDGSNQDYSTVWWYDNLSQPGGALISAEQGLQAWLSENGAQPTDEISVIWSQGESDVGYVGTGDAGREAYKNSTLAVFDYLQNNLGYENITFYLVPTGRVQAEGAANRGLPESAIEAMTRGTETVREVQSEIALERDDVRLTTEYADLNMVFEEGQIYGDSYDQDYYTWSRDFWHLGHDSYKVHGDRLAQYIALDRGESNVISFTDSFGNPAESVAITRAGLLDLNISATASSPQIQGTDLPDLVVGSLAADEISGGGGNDVIVGTSGSDTLTGGAGNDVFFYESVVDADRILDFDLNGDRLDLSELLLQSNYTGTNPFADGYISLLAKESNIVEVLYDADGAGAQPALTVAVLENIAPVESEINSLAEQVIITPTEF